jgi:hypothetical protein
MAPIIYNAVDTIVAKKDIIASTAIGRAPAIVKLDLLGLLSAATELENVLMSLAPVCVDVLLRGINCLIY